MKISKKLITNIGFVLIIGLMMYPPTKVYFIRLISFSPSEVIAENQQQIKNTDWQLKGLNTKSFNLKELENKVVFISFWATWCAPCIVEFPELIKLGQKHPEELEILTVSVDQNTKDIKKFLSQNKISLPEIIVMIHDPSQNITKNTYGVQKFPESYLLDKNLRIQKRIIGANHNWLSFK